MRNTTRSRYANARQTAVGVSSVGATRILLARDVRGRAMLGLAVVACTTAMARAQFTPYFDDFESYTVGNTVTNISTANDLSQQGYHGLLPTSLTTVPNANSTASSGGPFGVVVVDASSTPTTNLAGSGKGARIFDYNSANSGTAGVTMARNFVSSAPNESTAIQWSFDVRRTAATSNASPLNIALSNYNGNVGSSLSQAVRIGLTPNGTISYDTATSNGATANTTINVTTTFTWPAAYTMHIVANGSNQPLTYLAPGGQGIRTLSGDSFSAFMINKVDGSVFTVATNALYRYASSYNYWTDTADLGRAGLITGQAQAQIDFTVDNLLLRFPSLPVTWTNTAGGSWNSSGNWSAAFPSGAGSAAFLGSAITSAASISLDTATTLGFLQIDSTNSYSLSGTSLTINSGAGTSSGEINVASGSHSIASPVTLATSSDMTVAGGATLSFTGALGGAGGLRKLGSGEVVLSNAASSFAGNLTVVAGTFTLGTGASIAPASVTVTSTGTLRFNTGASNTLNNAQLLSGSRLNVASGQLTLGTGITTASFIADVSSGATLNLSGNSVTVSALSGSGTVNDSSVTPGTSVITISNQGQTGTFAGAITQTGSRAVALVKDSTGTNNFGTFILSGSSNYTGGTTINRGDLTVNNSFALGSGPVSVVANSTATDSRSRLLLGNGVSLANNISVTGLNTNFTGAIYVPGANDVATLTGSVTVQAGTLAGSGVGGHFAGPTGGTGYLEIAGPIIDAGTTPVIRLGAVRLSYSGPGNSYTRLNMSEGSLSLGATDAVLPSSTLGLGSNNTVTFDLRGFNQSLAQLDRPAGNNTNSNIITNSNNTTRSKLTITGAATSNLQGRLTGNLDFEYSGTGTVTFTNQTGLILSNTNSGDVTVSGAGGYVQFDSTLRNTTGNLVLSGSSSSVRLSTSRYTNANLVAAEVSTVSLTGSSSVTLPVTLRTGATPNLPAVVVANSLAIGSGSVLNLNNNDAVIRGLTLSQVVGLTKTGRLISATAGLTTTGDPRDAFATLAVFSNNFDGSPYFTSFDGVPVTTSDILVRYTYVGDSDLDGVIDGADYKRISESLTTGIGSGWLSGDFDLDGDVDANDFTAFSNAYTYFQTSGTSFGSPADYSGAETAAIPEPGWSVPFMLLTAPALVRYRRRSGGTRSSR